MPTVIDISGKQVAVETVAQGAEGRRFKITATVDGQKVEHQWTIGPEDGAVKTPTQQELQAALDAQRQKAAERAAWQAQVAALAKNLT